MEKGYLKGVTNKMIAYTFTIGVVIALLLRLISTMLPPTTLPYLTSILILAGIVVGFFNITPSEARDYVFYVTALVVVLSLGGDNLGQIQYIGVYLKNILATIVSFILPSVVIVGIKAIINLAKD